MLSRPLFFAAAVLASLAVAAPTPAPAQDTPTKVSARDVSAASILLAIAPSSSSCSNAPKASECGTNVQAAQYLPAAFMKYGVFDPHEIAAVIATMAFESVDFKYNTNQSPGRPGQGTRNMQMPTFNLKYAQSIPELKDKVAKITTATSADNLDDTTKNAILALVLPDTYSWASGAWFYSTQCSPTVKSALIAGGETGWNAYLGCVGVTNTDERHAKWTAALKAFGLSP